MPRGFLSMAMHHLVQDEYQVFLLSLLKMKSPLHQQFLIEQVHGKEFPIHSTRQKHT